jgi:hypothetical protein
MAKSTCLHIQDRESGPIRVVAIPWISIRVGRAAYCEVRLPDNDLPDLACRIKRRGNSWQIVPAASPSDIWINGRPIDGACALPYDTPFQIGAHCLTLRQDQTAEPDWSMYGPPSPRQLHDARPSVDLSELTSAHSREAAIAAYSPPEGQARRPYMLSSLEGTDAHAAPPPTPADILKSRWETRWKAAGAEIRARAEQFKPPGETGPSAYGAGFESVPLKEAHVPRFAKVVPPGPARSDGIDPHAGQDVQPENDPAQGQALESEGKRQSPTDSEQAFTIPSSALDRPVALPDVALTDELRDQRPDDAASSLAPETFWDHWSPTDDGLDSLGQDLPPVADGDVLDEYPGPMDLTGPQSQPVAETPNKSLLGDQAFVEPAIAQAGTAASEAISAGCDHSPEIEPQTAPTAADGILTAESPVTPGGLLYAAPLTRKGGFIPQSDDRGSEVKTVKSFAVDPPRQRLGDATDEWQWPSAREILAAHQAAQRARPQPAAKMRRHSSELPTVAREPGRWVPPMWLGGPPIALLVVLGGIASCMLSFAWASDSYSASIMTERLFSANRGGPKRPLPDGVGPPAGNWVRTTAQHLAHWALYASISGESDTGVTGSDGRALLERAIEVSPINPTARLALAQLDQQAGAGGVPMGRLGLSRDVLSLAFSASWLLAAGRKDVALEMYRRSLAIAPHRELTRYGAPRFSDDPAAPRYLLPGEDAVREIVRDLISQKEWPLAEWSRILPADTIVPVVAARLLREESPRDAEELIDLFLRADAHRTPMRAAEAVLAAARAEAHALLSHWRDAQEEYQRAIELVDDDTIRRSWWFNLADIASRLEDEGRRQIALRAALAAQTSDDISRRAADRQRASGQRGRMRSSGAKAN